MDHKKDFKAVKPSRLPLSVMATEPPQLGKFGINSPEANIVIFVLERFAKGDNLEKK